MCAGLYVTLGFVDIHVHAYAGTGARCSTPGTQRLSDWIYVRSGVTTVVDAAGPAGRHFEDFKRSHRPIVPKLGSLPRSTLVAMDGREPSNKTLTIWTPRRRQRRQEVQGSRCWNQDRAYDGPEWTPVERAVEAGTWQEFLSWWISGRFRPSARSRN